MAENETPHNGTDNNVIKLPNNHLFDRCSLCGANIVATIADTQVEATTWIKKNPESDEETEYVFCSICQTERVMEIRQFMTHELFVPAVKEIRDDFGSIKNLLLDGSRIYKIYESDTTDDNMRIISWKRKNSGLSAVVLSVGEDSEQVLFYNMGEMSLYDFKLSVEYIRNHFASEYGPIEEVEGDSKISLRSARLPKFRGRLLGVDSQFRFYDDKDHVGISIGFTEIRLEKRDLGDFICMLCAASTFLEANELSDLEEFQEQSFSTIYNFRSKVFIVNI